MTPHFPLAPRYRLDDELSWLEGIDPARNYWIWTNGEREATVAIPGIVAPSLTEFKSLIRQFRALQPGDRMTLTRTADALVIHCISPNCYAIETQISKAPVWHLFDQETLDSLLMTGHPDWQCAPKDIELGRRLLLRAWTAA